MAELPPITVSVESVIHDALRATVQAVAEQHQIKVESVSVQWIDVSDHSGPRFLVRSVEARTSKLY